MARLDKFQFLLLLALTAVGCIFIYGTGQETGGRLAGYWQRQLIFALIGLVVFVFISCVDYRWWVRYAWLLFAASQILLVTVLFWGQTINNAKSWLPVFGFTLQPSELAKPALILMLASVASAAGLRHNPRLKIAFMLILGLIPVLLIGLQPDWGGAIVFVPITLSLVFLAGISWRWLALGFLLAALTAPLVYKHVLAPYQRDRIRTFLNPASDTSRAGYNAHQSIIAVGSGGLWGKGFMRGNQHILGFLPRAVAPTDFIFTVIAEETGFIGAVGMVLAFIGILLSCMWTAFCTEDDQGRFIVVGVMVFFLVHIYVNIGMTLQICPIIGLPLPFVSYGGSFMLSVMIAAGLVQSVHIHRYEEDG